MIKREVVESIVDTYELSQRTRERVIDITNQRIEDISITSYNEIYEN